MTTDTGTDAMRIVPVITMTIIVTVGHDRQR
jgi:hypothetical protein